MNPIDLLNREIMLCSAARPDIHAVPDGKGGWIVSCRELDVCPMIIKSGKKNAAKVAFINQYVDELLALINPNTIVSKSPSPSDNLREYCRGMCIDYKTLGFVSSMSGPPHCPIWITRLEGENDLKGDPAGSKNESTNNFISCNYDALREIIDHHAASVLISQHPPDIESMRVVDMNTLVGAGCYALDAEWTCTRGQPKRILVIVTDGTNIATEIVSENKASDDLMAILVSSSPIYVFTSFDVNHLLRFRLIEEKHRGHFHDVQKARGVHDKNASLKNILSLYTGIDMPKDKSITMSFDLSKPLVGTQLMYCAWDVMATMILGLRLLP